MPEAALKTLTHWVFDMDGTLTVGVHDFPAIRRELEIPDGADILRHLETLSEPERRAKHDWLFEHERELAMRSAPAPGAIDLIRELRARGHRLGILTRNARELARITLAAIGIDDCFAPDDILGRDEAPPKPHPGGLEDFIRRWNVAPSRLAMVGDSPLDLECGRAAGTCTVLVNVVENRWPTLVDCHLQDCSALMRAL